MDRYIRRYIMKKYVGIFTALCLTTALMSGCGSSNTKTETAAAENEQVRQRILIIFPMQKHFLPLPKV